MALPHLDLPHLDVCVREYTSRLRDLIETLAITRKQAKELSACQEVMSASLRQIGLVLAQLPRTPGTERALTRLDWFLHTTEQAEEALEALVGGQRDALPKLVAQERVATQILSSLNAVVQGEPQRPQRVRGENPRRLSLVIG